MIGLRAGLAVCPLRLRAASTRIHGNVLIAGMGGALSAKQ
jgi:hypothetical protein